MKPIRSQARNTLGVRVIRLGTVTDQMLFDKDRIAHGHYVSKIAMRTSPQLISILGLMSRLTIVMPVLNEAAIIAGALRQLEPLRARGAEVIVVDGGSRDGTVQLAEPLADRVIGVARGRGAPLNAGAALGSAEDDDDGLAGAALA